MIETLQVLFQELKILLSAYILTNNFIQLELHNMSNWFMFSYDDIIIDAHDDSKDSDFKDINDTSIGACLLKESILYIRRWHYCNQCVNKWLLTLQVKIYDATKSDRQFYFCA